MNFYWKVSHNSGFALFRTLEGAMREYTRRTKKNHEAFLSPIWKN